MLGWLWKLMGLYAAALLVGTVSLFATALPPGADPSGFSNLVIAHRGDALNFPENSVPAIAGAKRLGADAVEIDVMMTRDGVLVALHDASLERTTNGTGRVETQSWDTISKLLLRAPTAVGNTKGGPLADPAVRIPRLKQVIETVIAQNLKLEIEMKTEIPNKFQASQTLAALFRQYNLYERAFVSSFDPRFLYYLRNKDPKIVTAFAIKSNPPYGKLTEFIFRRDAFMDYLGASIIEPSMDVADEAFIRKWLGAGKAINVWTPNSSRQKAFYRQFPVSITTDCPKSYC
ncbi:MAG: glycerophosphodiester phosphodiesterase family protein [Pseudomonadota bacterium]